MKSNAHTPEGHGHEEEAEGVAFHWIEDVIDRYAPDEPDNVLLEEQQQITQNLALQRHADIRLMLTNIASYEQPAQQRILYIVATVGKHRLRYVFTPGRAWISENDDDVRWLEQLLDHLNAVLITAD